MSTKYSVAAFSGALLLLRVYFGVLMMNHGYKKMENFAQIKTKFMNFLGLGSSVSLSLTIFAELFCALLIVIGLFTRLATIPLIVTMCVALFKAHNSDFFGEGEMAALYLGAFITILLTGPGKYSVDGISGK